MMINIITDKEIMKWNDRLKESQFYIKPEFISESLYPVISFYNRPIIQNHGFNVTQPIIYSNSYNDNNDDRRIKDPNIKYVFTFSVCEKRSVEFNDIFEKLKERDIETLFYNGNVLDKIKINDNFLMTQSYGHEIYNRKYLKYKYEFNGSLSSIIYYISLLEDAINFFQLIWGYKEKGEEICFLNFPIGTIVSRLEDRSKDYLIVDYLFIKDSNKNYSIKYYLIEVLGNENSTIINYGDLLKLSEREITYSRNNRIDTLLN